MSTYADLTIALEPGFYYHIYNRGNNLQKTFFIPDNYVYFLKKLDQYMSGYFHFYSYCLLPNHFHLLVKVKESEKVMEQAMNDFKTLRDFEKSKPEYFVSEKFRRFFLSYVKSLNKQQKKSGSLFQKNFRRKKIDSEKYFCELVRYIHLNPLKHKVSKQFDTYYWSSYTRILKQGESKLEKEEIFRWFGSKENFVIFHHEQIIDDEGKDYLLE